MTAGAIRILIVDDNPQNLKLTRIVLEHDGYEIRTAADATHALELLGSFRPAVILTDLQMPDMDGFEFTRRLKADPGTRDIVVVALTAYAMKGDEKRAYDAGCDGYIAKPFDTTKLGRQIREIVAAKTEKRDV